MYYKATEADFANKYKQYRWQNLIKCSDTFSMAKKKQFIFNHAYLNYDETSYIDNHVNDLQFAIQSTILILKLLSIGASDCATCMM